MKKKIIVNRVKSSVIIEPPQREDYHSHLFGGAPILGALSPLSKPPVIFDNSIGWKKTAESYGLPELQFNKKFDTYSCVIFSIAKATCYYFFKKYGIKITISEMYNAFYGYVQPGRGTTVRKGFEGFRKHGWIEDRRYPFTKDTTDVQYFAKPPKKIQIIAEGKLTEWDFHWEVIPNNITAINEAYKRTPVVLTGFAWASYYGEGVYFDYNNPANHAFLGLELDGKGNNFCDDTYPKDFEYMEDPKKDDLFKTLDRSYKYGSAHICWVTPKKNDSLIDKIMDYWRRLTTGAIYWGKSGTNKVQKITPENAGLAAITHLMRKPTEDSRNISKEELEDEYEVTEDFFGKASQLGVAKELIK